LGQEIEGFIGVTDNEWFAFLSQQPGIDEVNFWQPGRRSWINHLMHIPFLKKERQ